MFNPQVYIFIYSMVNVPLSNYRKLQDFEWQTTFLCNAPPFQAWFALFYKMC